MKRHLFLAMTLISSSGAVTAAAEIPAHGSHFSSHRTAPVRIAAAPRAHKKRVSHSLLGDWNPLEGLHEVTADLKKHLPKKQKRCSGTSLIDLPDVDLSWIKLPKLPAHGKSAAPKTEKAAAKHGMRSWFSRFPNPWSAGDAAPMHSHGNSAVEPPKPVPSAPST